MYLIAKDKAAIKSKYGQHVDLNISQVWNVVRTSACKAGEYALFQKDDGDNKKFSIFRGYISYDDICNDFEMIKYN